MEWVWYAMEAIGVVFVRPEARLQRVKKNITAMLYEVLRTSLRVPDGSYGPY